MRITADGGRPYRDLLTGIAISVAIASVVAMLLVATVSARAVGPSPSLTKDSDVCDCVNSGGNITYTICFDNPASYDYTDVVLIDTLPEEVTNVSASDNGSYYSANHTLIWNIGTLKAGAPQTCVTVNVTVTGTSGSIVNNRATLRNTYYPINTTFNETEICETQIPEFTTIALPVALILGLFLFFNHRKRSNQSPME